VVTSAEKPGRQSVFIELVSRKKGKDIGIFGEWLKTEKGKRPQMELEKLDSKLAVDNKTKREVVQKKSCGFRLTERDVELLGFLLDQKFASLEQIYFRFFDVRRKVTDELPQNLLILKRWKKPW